jgi:hypothetical protein
LGRYRQKWEGGAGWRTAGIVFLFFESSIRDLLNGGVAPAIDSGKLPRGKGAADGLLGNLTLGGLLTGVTTPPLLVIVD